MFPLRLFMSAGLAILLLPFSSKTSGEQLPLPDLPRQYSSEDSWEEQSMFCICMKSPCEQAYYGIIFENGKSKNIELKKGFLEPQESIEISDYTLFTIYGAKKVFWKNSSGVNSLDRKNFVHLLNGKEYGSCRPHSPFVIFEKLQQKLANKTDQDKSRTILDELQ